MAKVNLNKSRQRNTPQKHKTPKKKSAKKVFKSKKRLQKSPRAPPMPAALNVTGKRKQRNRSMRPAEMPSFLEECQVVSETTLINISDDEDVTFINNKKNGDDGGKLIVIPDESMLDDDENESTLKASRGGFETADYIPLEAENEDTVRCGEGGSKAFETSDYIPLEMENDNTVLCGKDDDVVYISDTDESSTLVEKSGGGSRLQQTISDGEDSITFLDDTVIEKAKAKSPRCRKKQRRVASPRKPDTKRAKRNVESPPENSAAAASGSDNNNVLLANIDRSALEKLSDVLSKIPNLPEFLSQLSKTKLSNEGNADTSRIDNDDWINTDRTYSSDRQFISDNIYHVERVRREGLRPIVIDGSNVAMQHSNGRIFSVKGLKICIDYFKVRGHKVYAFVPSYRMKLNQSSNQKLLMKLEKDGLVYLTSSRDVLGHKICSYDDRILVKVAAAMDAVIVTNDNYRDLIMEDRRLVPVIKNNILSPTWVGDMIIFPDDPLGRNGPRLRDFLRY